jgi:hypothetical protein
LYYFLFFIFYILYKQMSGFTNDTNPSILGGGVPGGQPRLLGGGAGGGRGSSSGMEGGNNRAISRLESRRVLNHRVFPNGNPQVITPFRRYFNAGDTAGTVNSYPSPLVGPSPNPLGGNSMVSRIHARSDGTNTGAAFYSGNPKFVYDGADYVRFKKIAANNKTYNDLTFGGAGASYVSRVLGRVRS